MKATKIFKYIGILFVVIGLVAGTGIITCSLGIQNKEGILAGLFFLAMFCGIGGLFAVIGFNT